METEQELRNLLNSQETFLLAQEDLIAYQRKYIKQMQEERAMLLRIFRIYEEQHIKKYIQVGNLVLGVKNDSIRKM